MLYLYMCLQVYVLYFMLGEVPEHIAWLINPSRVKSIETEHAFSFRS